MQFLIVIHLTAMVLWMSGLLLVTTQLRQALKRDISPQIIKPVLAPLAKIFMLLGMVITVLTGVFQFFTRGAEYYIQQGWFHAKISFIAILIIMTIMAFIRFVKYSNGEVVTQKSLLLIHITSAISMLLIFVCTSFRF